MSYRLINPILRVVAAPPVSRRSFHVAQSVCASKASQFNELKKPQVDGVGYEVPGGKLPEYSGPSISEKKSGKAQNIDSNTASQLSENRKDEFADSMFEHPRELKKGADKNWDGKIHQTGRSSRSTQASDYDTTGKPKQKGTKLTKTDEEMDWANAKRNMSTKWNNSDLRSEGLKDDLADDARRLKQKVTNTAEKAVLSAGGKMVDMKDGAQELWHKTKKAARNVKESVQETAKEILEPVGSSTTSDQATGPVPKNSLSDGPQEMPQGVGVRARDEKGRPMETGTRGS